MAKDEKPKEKATPAVVRIKYMGASDSRTLSASDTFGDRVPDGLGVDLEFSEANGFIEEVEGLDPEILKLLLDEQYERDGTGDFIKAFKDVTDDRVVPDNEWQKRWRPRGLPNAREVRASVGGPDAMAVGGGNVVGSGLTAGATGSPVAGGSGGGEPA